MEAFFHVEEQDSVDLVTVEGIDLTDLDVTQPLGIKMLRKSKNAVVARAVSNVPSTG